MLACAATLLTLLQTLPPPAVLAAPPAEIYAARRARLLARLPSDAAVIVPGNHLVGVSDLPMQDASFWYLSGVEAPYAVLVVTARRTALFLPELYQFAGAQYPMADERFRRAAWNRPRKRLAPGPDAVRATGIAEIYPVNELAARLPDLLGSARSVYVPLAAPDLYAPAGFRAPKMVARQMVDSIVERLPPGREVQDVAPHVARLRLVKDEHEVRALRRAAEISVGGMLAAMRAVRPGMNDLEVAGIMEAEWKRRGSPRASFAPIVASGPDTLEFFTLRGERYHAVDRVMREGELLFVDYGAAEYDRYASDLCRTLPVSGRFRENQRRYYDIVLEAQNAAISAIKPGVMMLEVVRAAAGVFQKHGLERFEDVAAMGEDHVWGVMPSPTHYLARHEGFGGYSATGLGVRELGHHIGLEVTESRDYTTPLEPGWVFTVEPKLYIPDEQIAIMIEDMVLVTRDGCELLSAGLPREAEAIERIMAGPK